MRRPTCSATLSKPQPDQKPKSSQRLGPQGFTLKGMPVRLSSQRTRQTQGIALVIVLLSAMILMVSLLAISATMTISSQRTTVDQGVTLQAQYAAEAGAARATTRLAEIDGVMRQIDVTNSTRTQIEGHIRNYCNGAPATFPSSFTQPVTICEVGSGNLSNQYSVFTTYIPNSAYPSGVTASAYWQSVFGSSSASTKITSDASGTESWYTVTHRNAANAAVGPLIPKRVRLIAPNSYRFEFEVAPTRSDGEIRAGGRVVATRRVQQRFSGTYHLGVLLPSYARNFMFRDVTTNLDGDQLYFAGGETFGGPVHTSETPGFAKTTVNGTPTVPVFTDDFTSCAPNGNFSGYSTPRSTARTEEEKSTFQGSTPQYGIDPCIDLPTNSNNQKRASFGGDATDTRPVSNTELLVNAWHYYNGPNPNDYDGIYYSRGSDDYKQRNYSDSWLGGMYIRGDVDQLRLLTSSDGKRQVISVRQGSTTTTFTENTDGTWTVTPPSPGKRLIGKFNGMVYVDGDINDMRGGGTTKADLAPKSKLMVTSTGKVLLKDDITYVDMPSADRPESEVNAALAAIKENVLGIYSSGEKCEPVNRSAKGCGSILADGANNKDLNIHASIMATKEISRGTRKGEGFGAVRNDVNLGAVRQEGRNRKVQIKLFGGVIERQSQTVGDLDNNGYSRNYKYDKRFRSGFAPPFFPEQAEGGESAVIKKWEDEVGQADADGNTNSIGIGTEQSVWQTVGN